MHHILNRKMHFFPKILTSINRQKIGSLHGRFHKQLMKINKRKNETKIICVKIKTSLIVLNDFIVIKNGRR